MNNLKDIYINKSHQLKKNNLNTQPSPSPQTSIDLRENKICMSGLDTAYRKFDNTPEEKFQDQ